MELDSPAGLAASLPAPRSFLISRRAALRQITAPGLNLWPEQQRARCCAALQHRRLLPSNGSYSRNPAAHSAPAR